MNEVYPHSSNQKPITMPKVKWLETEFGSSWLHSQLCSKGKVTLIIGDDRPLTILQKIKRFLWRDK